MTVSFSNTPAILAQYVWPELLKTPEPTLIANVNAEHIAIPYNSGTTSLQVRFQPLPPAVNPIEPGSQGPPPFVLQRQVISVTPQLYGGAVFIDRRSVEQDQVPWLAAAAERLLFSVRQGQDFLYYNELMAGASFYDCRYGTNGDSPTEITPADFNEIYGALQNNNAPYVSGIMQGTLQFNSFPQSNSYLCITNPAASANLLSTQGFSQVGSYPIENSQRAPSELGSLNGNFRFLVSSNVPVSPQMSAKGNTVVNTFVMGHQPYAGASVEADSVHFLYRSPEYSNALGLQVSLGATLFFGAVITQDTWILRVGSSGAGTFILGNPYIS